MWKISWNRILQLASTNSEPTLYLSPSILWATTTLPPLGRHHHVAVHSPSVAVVILTFISASSHAIVGEMVTLSFFPPPSFQAWATHRGQGDNLVDNYDGTPTQAKVEIVVSGGDP